MTSFLDINLKYLRSKRALNQHKMAILLGFTRTAWSNYENNISSPKIDDLIKISNEFGYTVNELIETDLSQGNKSANFALTESGKKGNLIGNPMGNLIGNYEVNEEGISSHLVAESEAIYEANVGFMAVPMVNVQAAAGMGAMVSTSQHFTGVLKLPKSLLSGVVNPICIRVFGPSMQPTLLHNSWVLISKYYCNKIAQIPNNRAFVIIDNDNNAYVKRVVPSVSTNTLQLISDNADQLTFAPINLNFKRVAELWQIHMVFTNLEDNEGPFYTEMEKKVNDLTILVNKLT